MTVNNIIQKDGIYICLGDGSVQSFANKLVEEICPTLEAPVIVRLKEFEFRISNESTVDSIMYTYLKLQLERDYKE